VVLSGVTSAGNGFAYVSGSCGSPYLEIVDPQGQMKAFSDLIAAAAEGWDGSDPIRGSPARRLRFLRPSEGGHR
jgi:hypothetical protein